MKERTLSTQSVKSQMMNLMSLDAGRRNIEQILKLVIIFFIKYYSYVYLILKKQEATTSKKGKEEKDDDEDEDDEDDDEEGDLSKYDLSGWGDESEDKIDLPPKSSSSNVKSDTKKSSSK